MAERTSALLSALSVALKAQQGIVTPEDVAQMVARAQDLLEPGHPGRVAALLFAAEWQAHRRDLTALAGLGAQLQHAVIVATRPDPPGMERRDIHG